MRGLRAGLRRLARGAGIALALLGVSACSPDTRPNLVLVTLDTTRADRIGAYGDATASTPHLDALAARGVRFDRAYANAPLTLPSHATMLTGLDPLEHGIHDNGQRLPDAVATVTEALAAAGYDTGAFVAAYVLDSGFGLDRGFGVYDDELAPNRSPVSGGVAHRDGAIVTERARAWLHERGGSPYFLWVHYFDVHEPRRPPAPFDANPDDYAGAVSYVDAQVGALLEAVNKASPGRETVVVVAADHGESLGEHGEATHGIVAYDSTLRIPLIAAGPGFAPGTVSEAFVGARDIAATLARAAGLAPPAPGRAFALQEAATTGVPQDRTEVFVSFGPARRFGWARLSGIRDARFKLTAEPPPLELYDVVADPGETRDLSGEHPAEVARLAALHRERLAAAATPAPDAGGAEVRERLAALGYMAAPERFDDDRAPDPRRLVGALGWIDAARARAAEGHVADAIRALELLASKPLLRTLALRALAPIYLEAGRVDDAAAAYAELVERAPAPEFRLGLARAEMMRGDAAAALRVLDEDGLGLDPRDRRAAGLRAEVLLTLGRPEEAAALAARVLEEDPGDDSARALLALARAEGGGEAVLEKEIEALRREIAGRPPEESRARRGALAELLYRAGRAGEAAAVLAEAGEAAPELLAERAALAARHGNPRLALELYERALEARPSQGEWRRATADLERELRRDPRAEARYDELIAATPDDPTLYLARGVVRFRNGRLDLAREDFERALALDPSLAEAHLDLALVALRAGDDRTAEAHLQRAVELRPDYAKAHFHLARIYRKRGDPRAAEHAERAAASSHREEP